MWIPYKVFVFFAGVICGRLNEYESFRGFIDVSFVSGFSVNGIQTVFIPALVFYDTFSVDARSLLSARPGALLAMCTGYGKVFFFYRLQLYIHAY
jgi:hypothetical protein